mmetsp:Transcript_6247/g.9746  ORF Transcript_6247/g.9746 Transcript_6247/m.9746 type:complete len:170 (+) Transcript_6247:112-621(+)
MDPQTTTNEFCTGPGRVMMMGFQGAYDGGPCMLFLFEGAVVDTATKYVFAILGAFLLAFGMHVLGMIGHWYRSNVSGPLHGEERRSLSLHLPSVLLYGLQMLNAYWLMLLVMTYEQFIFSAIILGLTLGYFVCCIIAPYRHPSWFGKTTMVQSVNTPCCSSKNSDYMTM